MKLTMIQAFGRSASAKNLRIKMIRTEMLQKPGNQHVAQYTPEQQQQSQQQQAAFQTNMQQHPGAMGPIPTPKANFR